MSNILKVELISKTITIPLPAEGPASLSGYRSPHVDVKLTREQADALHLLRRGLAVSGARMANGRQVTTAPMAVNWLLEQFSPE